MLRHAVPRNDVMQSTSNFLLPTDMFHIFIHELRLIFREPRFWIPFVIPPVVLAASQMIAVKHYGGQVLDGMEGYMMLLLGCLMAPMGAPLAADSFAGERERKSLELLQLLPIKPSRLFWGKLFAVMPFSVVFAVVVQGAYWLGQPSISRETAAAAFLGAISVSLLVNAWTLLVSLRAKTVRAATQRVLFLIIPLMLVLQLSFEMFLADLTIPLVTLGVSVLVVVASVKIGLRRFVQM